MHAPNRFDRIVRRYPRQWRARYGEELTALLEDTYGSGPVPLRQRVSLVRGAFVEHLRGSAFTPGPRRESRVRSGALIVLCGWAVFMVAGSAFAKYFEHWDLATPAAARRVPADAITILTFAAVIAVTLIALGAVAVVGPVARAIRSQGWGDLGRAMLVAGSLLVLAAVATGGAVLLAHSQTSTERNASWVDTAVGGIWGLVLLAALAGCTWAAVAAASRIELRGALVRLEATCAIGVFVCMAVGLAGTVTWWVAIARHSPRFLENALGPVGTWGSVAPPVMIGIALVMFAAMLTAAAGVWRIVGAGRAQG
jgi:hypothetical protein